MKTPLLLRFGDYGVKLLFGIVSFVLLNVNLAYSAEIHFYYGKVGNDCELTLTFNIYSFRKLDQELEKKPRGTEVDRHSFYWENLQSLTFSAMKKWLKTEEPEVRRDFDGEGGNFVHETIYSVDCQNGENIKRDLIEQFSHSHFNFNKFTNLEGLDVSAQSHASPNLEVFQKISHLFKESEHDSEEVPQKEMTVLLKTYAMLACNLPESQLKSIQLQTPLKILSLADGHKFEEGTACQFAYRLKSEAIPQFEVYTGDQQVETSSHHVVNGVQIHRFHVDSVCPLFRVLKDSAVDQADKIDIVVMMKGLCDCSGEGLSCGGIDLSGFYASEEVLSIPLTHFLINVETVLNESNPISFALIDGYVLVPYPNIEESVRNTNMISPFPFRADVVKDEVGKILGILIHKIATQ